VIVRPCGLIVLAVLISGCERESRRYHDLPPSASPAATVRLTALQAGGPASGTPSASPYQKNAYGIGEGKRLYAAFNCVGCHAMGGGAMGPALMDDKWIYGSAPEQIFSSIVQGRPDGMPAFGGRVPEPQVWQLVAYVQSMSGQVPQDAAPGRNDDLSGKKPEARKEREHPTQTGHR
jgi:cytochrome c oxidase cbb3-type subunit 3